jgi:hypothetical protein
MGAPALFGGPSGLLGLSLPNALLSSPAAFGEKTFSAASETERPMLRRVSMPGAPGPSVDSLCVLNVSEDYTQTLLESESSEQGKSVPRVLGRAAKVLSMLSLTCTRGSI